MALEWLLRPLLFACISISIIGSARRNKYERSSDCSSQSSRHSPTTASDSSDSQRLKNNVNAARSRFKKCRFLKIKRRLPSANDIEEKTEFERVAVRMRPAKSRVHKKSKLKWKDTVEQQDNSKCKSTEHTRSKHSNAAKRAEKKEQNEKTERSEKLQKRHLLKRRKIIRKKLYKRKPSERNEEIREENYEESINKRKRSHDDTKRSELKRIAEHSAAEESIWIEKSEDESVADEATQSIAEPADPSLREVRLQRSAYIIEKMNELNLEASMRTDEKSKAGKKQEVQEASSSEGPSLSTSQSVTKSTRERVIEKIVGKIQEVKKAPEKRRTIKVIKLIKVMKKEPPACNSLPQKERKPRESAREQKRVKSSDERRYTTSSSTKEQKIERKRERAIIKEKEAEDVKGITKKEEVVKWPEARVVEPAGKEKHAEHKTMEDQKKMTARKRGKEAEKMVHQSDGFNASNTDEEEEQPVRGKGRRKTVSQEAKGMINKVEQSSEIGDSEISEVEGKGISVRESVREVGDTIRTALGEKIAKEEAAEKQRRTDTVTASEIGDETEIEEKTASTKESASDINLVKAESPRREGYGAAAVRCLQAAKEATAPALEQAKNACTYTWTTVSDAKNTKIPTFPIGSVLGSKEDIPEKDENAEKIGKLEGIQQQKTGAVVVSPKNVEEPKGTMPLKLTTGKLPFGTLIGGSPSTNDDEKEEETQDEGTEITSMPPEESKEPKGVPLKFITKVLPFGKATKSSSKKVGGKDEGNQLQKTKSALVLPEEPAELKEKIPLKLATKVLPFVFSKADSSQKKNPANVPSEVSEATKSATQSAGTSYTDKTLEQARPEIPSRKTKTEESSSSDEVNQKVENKEGGAPSSTANEDHRESKNARKSEAPGATEEANKDFQAAAKPELKELKIANVAETTSSLSSSSIQAGIRTTSQSLKIKTPEESPPSITDDDNDMQLLSIPACKTLKVMQENNSFRRTTTESENKLLRDAFAKKTQFNGKIERILSRAIDQAIDRVKDMVTGNELKAFLRNRRNASNLMLDALKIRTDLLPPYWRADEKSEHHEEADIKKSDENLRKSQESSQSSEITAKKSKSEQGYSLLEEFSLLPPYFRN